MGRFIRRNVGWGILIVLTALAFHYGMRADQQHMCETSDAVVCP